MACILESSGQLWFCHKVMVLGTESERFEGRETSFINFRVSLLMKNFSYEQPRVIWILVERGEFRFGGIGWSWIKIYIFIQNTAAQWHIVTFSLRKTRLCSILDNELSSYRHAYLYLLAISSLLLFCVKSPLFFTLPLYTQRTRKPLEGEIWWYLEIQRRHAYGSCEWRILSTLKCWWDIYQRIVNVMAICWKVEKYLQGERTISLCPQAKSWRKRKRWIKRTSNHEGHSSFAVAP